MSDDYEPAGPEDDDAIPVEFDGVRGGKVKVDAGSVSRVIADPYVDANGSRAACRVYSDGGSGHVLGTADEIQDRLSEAFEAASRPSRP